MYDPTVEYNKIRQHDDDQADVILVGAGIFGCAMAFALANQGRSVILIERSWKEPDRIVGELLQPGGVSALEKLGLIDCLEGIDAIPVYGYEVIYYGTGVRIPYPSDYNNDAGVYGYSNIKGGKPEGRAFHHGRFISQLRKACANHPNIKVIETLVTETIKSADSGGVIGVKCEKRNHKTGNKEIELYHSHLTIIADGFASKFRKQYINKTPIVKSKFYALELIDCPLPVPNHGTVILGDASPVLLYQIGTHETRALIDVPETILSTLPGAAGIHKYLHDIILPSLPQQVQECFSKALNNGKSPRSMPNSWLPPSTQLQKGVILLGDAMNMRHPLTGGGMTVAFNDVVFLSSLLSPDRIPSLADTTAVQKAMRDFHWKRKSLSSIINILAMALYSLFAANDKQLKALQRGCFAYFQRGGNCIDGPVGLLGGIIRQPFVLFYHFFAVALLSIKITVSESINSLTQVWKFPMAVLESVMIFWKACIVIFPFIFSEIRN